MNTNVSMEKLLSIASKPLSERPVSVNLPDFDRHGLLAEELLELLRQRNGFYAFESALHIFPAAPFEREITLGRWNSYGLWRHNYGSLAEDMLFFAEDVFGNQFCLHDDQVCFFDAETGKLDAIGRHISEWVEKVLSEFEVWTGYPLAHAWQVKQGCLPVGYRLMPKVPFVLGGDYALENLCAISSVSGMKTRGNLARQIKELPDGAAVEFRIIE